jgi:DNA mismatch repair ATPase MutS
MDPRVKLGHMDCLVDAEKSDSVENVTFLYHLADGSSPRSYGINVAKLARLPEEVIAMAVEQSKNFEEKLKAFSSKENSLANGTLNISNYNVVSAFYDRVMSIVESNMDPNEFSYVIAEIWTRFSAACPAAKTNLFAGHSANAFVLGLASKTHRSCQSGAPPHRRRWPN